jgi:hypothetical protein
VTVARLFTAVFGLAAVNWTIFVAPVFWSETSVAEAAAHIIDGETYKPDVMNAMIAELDRNRAAAFRSAIFSKVAIIRLRAAEDVVAAGDPQLANERLNELRQSIDDALANAPNDSYMWLILFWLNNKQNGFKPEYLRYLKMSYTFGPNEAWIAIRRSRLVMSGFTALPSDLAEAATIEFVNLVRSQQYTEAADIIAGPAWPIRRVLLARLKNLPEINRRIFAKELYDKNLDDVAVPGIKPRPPRPWR